MSVFPADLDHATAQSAMVRARQRDILAPLRQHGRHALPEVLQRRDELGPLMVFRLLERIPRFGRKSLIDLNAKCLRGVEIDGVLVTLNLFRPISDITDRQCRLLTELLVPTPEELQANEKTRARRRRARERS